VWRSLGVDVVVVHSQPPFPEVPSAPLESFFAPLAGALNSGSDNGCDSISDRDSTSDKNNISNKNINSNDKACPKRGRYVQEAFAADGVALLEATQGKEWPKGVIALLCGHKDMCQTITKQLVEFGVDKKDILLNF